MQEQTISQQQAHQDALWNAMGLECDERLAETDGLLAAFDAENGPLEGLSPEKAQAREAILEHYYDALIAIFKKYFPEAFSASEPEPEHNDQAHAIISVHDSIVPETSSAVVVEDEILPAFPIATPTSDGFWLQ